LLKRILLIAGIIVGVAILAPFIFYFTLGTEEDRDQQLAQQQPALSPADVADKSPEEIAYLVFGKATNDNPAGISQFDYTKGDSEASIWFQAVIDVDTTSKQEKYEEIGRQLKPKIKQYFELVPDINTLLITVLLDYNRQWKPYLTFEVTSNNMTEEFLGKDLLNKVKILKQHR